MKPCRQCGREVSTYSDTCQYCGIENPAPAWAPGRRPPGSVKAAGFLGAGLLAFGVFAPFIAVPLAGQITYFNNGTGDGIIILVLAGVSAILIATDKLIGLWVTGGLSAALLGYVAIRVNSGISEMRSELQRQDLGLFQGLGEAMIQGVQFQWGFGLLVIGTLLLLAVAAYETHTRQAR